MTEQTTSKVPQIRFKGFEGDWEPCELGEITTKIGSGKTPRGGKTGYLSSGIPLIRSQNIFSDTVNFEGIAFISDETDEEMSNSRVLQNDVLLNITGASIGRSAVYRSGELANVNQHVCIIRARGNHHSDFIQLNLASTRGQAAIDNSQAGGAREGLNFQQIGKFSFQFPSLTEQTQIGGYFRMLDRLIGLHQRKHDKLMTLKKAMLQKMFSQTGASTPEIRFEGFSGEWKMKQLGEVSQRIVRKNSDLESLRPLTISAIHGLVDQTDYFTKRVASKDVSSYFLIRNGEFAYNKSYSEGFPFGAVRRLDRYTSGVLSTLYIVFSPQLSEVCSDFLLTLFETDLWHTQVANLAAEGARNHGLLNISAADFFTISLKLPCSLAEQQKIGTYFRQLDELIFKHATQLQKLQQIKSACLEKMFV
jgi:type I restriction enzyme S subunit